ncbi:hypothetical protein C8R47DRAFT_743722 [Mycena vitilis]|nr:hypothetical protein C8R47DRAFT_743722 [Mycena vitilis]
MMRMPVGQWYKVRDEGGARRAEGSFERLRRRAGADTSARLSRRARAAGACVAFGGRNEGGIGAGGSQEHRAGDGAPRGPPPLLLFVRVRAPCSHSGLRPCTVLVPTQRGVRRATRAPLPFVELRPRGHVARDVYASNAGRPRLCWCAYAIGSSHPAGIQRSGAVEADGAAHAVAFGRTRKGEKEGTGNGCRQEANNCHWTATVFMVRNLIFSRDVLVRRVHRSHSLRFDREGTQLAIHMRQARAVHGFAGARMRLASCGRNEGGREGVPWVVMVVLCGRPVRSKVKSLLPAPFLSFESEVCIAAAPPPLRRRRTPAAGGVGVGAGKKGAGGAGTETGDG